MMRKNINRTRKFYKNTYNLTNEDVKFVENFNYLWSDETNQLLFTQSPLKDYAFESNRYSNQYLEACRINGTERFLYDFIYRFKHSKNFIATNTANTGVGKSYKWMALGGIGRKYCYDVLGYDYDVYPVSNIVFEIDEYLARGDVKKPNMIFHNDEEDWEKFGIGSYVNNEKYKRWQKIMRSQQLHHLSCSPSSRSGWDFPKHWSVDVLGYNEEACLSCSIVFNPDNMMKYPVCSIIMPHPDMVNPKGFVDSYEKRKEEHQESFLEEDLGSKTRKKWLDYVVSVLCEDGVDFLVKRERILKSGEGGVSHNYLTKRDIKTVLMSMFPRGFGTEERDFIIDLVYNFCWDKSMRGVDKEYILEGLKK